MRGSVLQRASMPIRSLLFSWRWLARLGNLMLPSSCAICGSSVAGVICDACQQSYLADPTDRCQRCAIELSGLNAICGTCLAHPPSFDASYAATRYAAPVDQLVHSLKFRAQLALAPAFAERMFEHLLTQGLIDFDLVLPVPLSAGRLAARGFNQALEIARPLARALQRPLRTDVCVRLRNTQPQAGLALADRQGNMRGAFAVSDRAAVHGRHLLVVDDVMTTGHTLESLAACLKRHGVSRVTNCVFARTPLR